MTSRKTMNIRDTELTSYGLEKKVEVDEHQKQRRRALQARHRATLASLFDSLKTVVCPGSKKTPAKWKILDHAKGYLKEKETCLSYLLSLKRSYLEREEGPNSLEEVQEHFRRLCSNCVLEPSSRRGRYRCSVLPNVEEEEEEEEEALEESSSEISPDDPTDETPFSQSSSLSASNIQEFEGYLYFYRQTLELLVRSGVLAPEQTGLAVVSEAISGLWSNLPPERRAAFQQCTLGASPYAWMGCCFLKEAHAEEDCSQESSQFPSQEEASPSSLLQEDLLQDAYDVVRKDMDSSSQASPEPLQSSGGDFERLREIYKDIMGFVKGHMSTELEFTEELCMTAEYQELFLKCSESFGEPLSPPLL
ncbi:stimulated by retinoic acid gene 8 protein homolog [Alosa pseudoharengus]|uniref:stimulated by retinoic acid gene 8 protein homolog n=1 Tax=Alosa pseudoharengus TaxID=34774 RepID=UPI003F894392